MSTPRFTPGAAVTERTRRLRKIWRAMTPEERVLAIRSSGEDRGAALVVSLRSHLAKTLNIRPATVQSWGIQQVAESTLRAPLSEELIADLLIGFHLTQRVPLLSAFLDAAGIPHTDGSTDLEGPVEVEEERVLQAADALLANFPEHECKIYFATLLTLEGGAWGPLETRIDDSLKA
ncbi:MAG TPA: HMG-box domain-containing protein [Longimicrobium sp.]|jgi:hypothetical protein